MYHDKELRILQSSAGKSVTLDVAPDFNPSAAKLSAPVEPGKPVELIDQEGRRASINGAAVVFQNGMPQIQLIAEAPDPSLFGELVGQVVDTKGQPVKDAAVICVGSLVPPRDLSLTDANGAFGFYGLFNWPQDGPTFKLFVIKDGYTGLDTAEERYIPNAGGPRQLPKPLVLSEGYSIRLRILDASGEPVEGAWIVPDGIGARLAQFTKSDSDGFSTLRNQPVGITNLHVKYGDQWANEKVVVTATSAAESPLDIRLRNPANPKVADQLVLEIKPIQPGEVAPEFAASAWTDGKDHKLSDYHGQVVFIDFWGVWCGPCVQSIPTMKRLHDKFGDKVAFVGIHTAGTEMRQVKKLLDLKAWDVLVGLDKGSEAADGETAKLYGVRGYPTAIIVDRDGKIAFTTGTDIGGDREKFMAKTKVLAEEIALPWPIDKDATEEEVLMRLQKLNEHMFSKEIEKALATQ